MPDIITQQKTHTHTHNLETRLISLLDKNGSDLQKSFTK